MDKEIDFKGDLKGGQALVKYKASSKNLARREGKDLVLQYTVKHEQKIDCGGGYVKILPSTVDQKNFNGDSDYK